MAEIDSDSRARGFAICTTPRAGSNLFSQFLTSTGVLGRPLEYFNGPARRVLTNPAYPDDPEAQIRRILTDGTTPNGVYGVKLFPDQLDAVAARVPWMKALPRLAFVLLRRRDLLGQALSWHRALATEQYRSTQISERAAIYDGAAIMQRLRTIVGLQARWTMFFARTGIEPLAIAYEDVVDQPQAAVDAVAQLIGLPGAAPIDTGSVDLVVQRDEEIEAWRRRFLTEHGSADFMDKM
jgi:trehalose 2-sulfotransferase